MMVRVSFLPTTAFNVIKAGVWIFTVTIVYLYRVNYVLGSWLAFLALLAVLLFYVALFLNDMDLFLLRKYQLRLSDKRLLITRGNQEIAKEIFYDDIQTIGLRFGKRRNRMYLEIKGINTESSLTLRLVEFWFASFFSNAPHVVSFYKFTSFIFNTAFESKLDYNTIASVRKELNLVDGHPFGNAVTPLQ